LRSSAGLGHEGSERWPRPAGGQDIAVCGRPGQSRVRIASTAKNVAQSTQVRAIHIGTKIRREEDCVAELAIERLKPRSIAVLAAAMALSIIWPLTRIGDGSGRLSHILTYNFPISVLIWAILVFVVDTTPRWRFRMVALVAILSTSVATYWAATTDYSVTGARRSAAESSTHGIENRNSRESSIAGRDTRKSLVKLSMIMSRQRSQLFLDHVAYLSELKRTNLAELTSPVHIASHDDAALTEANLSDAKAIVAKYRDLYNARMAAARQDITTSSLPQNLKDEALHGFDESAKLTREKTQRLWSDEMAILDQLGQQYEFLASRRLQWRLQGTQVVFNQPADLAEFNSHLMQMRQISSDELAIQNEINASAQSRLTALRGIEKQVASAPAR
jgi:hypothetical protein